MITRIREVTVGSSRYVWIQSSLIGKLFPLLEKMTTIPEMVPWLPAFANTSLKTLNIPYQNLVPVWLAQPLTNITSLTLGKGVCIQGLDNLPNLTHLSMMFITDRNKAWCLYKNSSKTLKRLHLGIGFGQGVPVDSVDLWRHVPQYIDSLEYLECDKEALKKAKYTGIGRINYGAIMVWYYEGELLEGKRHGRGMLVNGRLKCTGIWENDDIKSGSILYENAYYEGGVLLWDGIIVPHGTGMIQCLKGEKIYKGSFRQGLMIEGTLKDGPEIVQCKYTSYHPVRFSD
jgi:hypothetical protein